MRLTLSVRSFHVPATPSTSAWPPSLPSVPTSRATRVTSSANERELVDHRVDRVLQLERPRRAPSTVIFCERSPLATAVVTWAMLRTWSVRFDAMKFTLLGQVAPRARDALDLGLAAELALGADLAATRVTSSANDESWSTIVLTCPSARATSPRASTVIFCDRSPFATAVVTWRCCAPGRSGCAPCC